MGTTYSQSMHVHKSKMRGFTRIGMLSIRRWGEDDVSLPDQIRVCTGQTYSGTRIYNNVLDAPCLPLQSIQACSTTGMTINTASHTINMSTVNVIGYPIMISHAGRYMLNVIEWGDMSKVEFGTHDDIAVASKEINRAKGTAQTARDHEPQAGERPGTEPLQQRLTLHA